MATVGSLNVVLTASSAKFTAGMKQAQSSVGSFVETVSSAKSALLGLAGALGIGLSVGAFAGMVKGSLEAIDSTKDLASQLGVTTDALTALNYTATINGSSAEALGTALGFMEKNLAEVALTGKGAAADALNALGLSAEKLTGMEPDKAFIAIAEAVSKIPNPMERTNRALDIFGKGGKDIINVLNMGKAGIEAYIEEAKRLGVVLNQIDAEKAGAAKDAIDRLGFVIEGLKNKLAIELAPYIEAAANKLAEMGSSGGKAGEFIVSAVEMATKAVAAMIGYTADLEQAWLKVRQAVLAAAIVIIKASSGEARIATDPNATQKVMNPTETTRWAVEMVKELQTIQTEVDKLSTTDRLGKITAFFDGIRQSADTAAQAAGAAKPPPQAIQRRGSFSLQPISDLISGISKGGGAALKDIGGVLAETWKNLMSGKAGSITLPGAPGALARNIGAGAQAASGISGGTIEQNTGIAAKEAQKQTPKFDQLIGSVKDMAAKFLPAQVVELL